MKNTIDQIRVEPNGIVLVREITPNGEYCRTSYAPEQDISEVDEQVKQVCENTWTAEVIAAYKATSNKAIKGVA